MPVREAVGSGSDLGRGGTTRARQVRSLFIWGGVIGEAHAEVVGSHGRTLTLVLLPTRMPSSYSGSSSMVPTSSGYRHGTSSGHSSQLSRLLFSSLLLETLSKPKAREKLPRLF